MGDRLRDVPGKAVEAIHAMQPFHFPRPEEHPLAVIQALSTEDKHRVILEAVTFTEKPDATAFSVKTTDIAGDVRLEIAPTARRWSRARGS